MSTERTEATLQEQAKLYLAKRGVTVRYAEAFLDGLQYAAADASGRAALCAHAVGEAPEVSTEYGVPIPMTLTCPYCNAYHVDRGEWATRPHRTHLCEECGRTFRPANVATVGVETLSIDHFEDEDSDRGGG